MRFDWITVFKMAAVDAFKIWSDEFTKEDRCPVLEYFFAPCHEKIYSREFSFQRLTIDDASIF
jgi:hypothetical protein